MNDEIYQLFPPGRLVQGSPYEPNTTDADGKPLVTKTGPNAGQPRIEYYNAIAIPKTPGVTHWAHEKSDDPNVGAWGMNLWNAVAKMWPNGQYQRPDFAFKITDGDSTIPNKKGNRPCDATGFPGCWVLKFGGGYAPKIVNANGSELITEVGAIKLGFFVQMYASISSNKSDQSPGIYLNHRIMALTGWGPEIINGPDPSSVGFGAGPLPPGASSVPLGGMTLPGNGSLPPPPGAPLPPPGVASLPPAGAPAIPAPPPNTAFSAGVTGAPPISTAPPGAVIPPPPSLAPPPPPVGPTMTAKAEGRSRADFVGWTDAQLVEHGYMLP
jgi:hypothetical protein